MHYRILMAIITISLPAFGLIGVPLASAEDDTPPQSDSLPMLLGAIADSRANNLLEDSLGDTLINWVVENLIAPHTGETPFQVRSRLAPGPTSVSDLMPSPGYGASYGCPD